MAQTSEFTKIRAILKWVWENPNSSFYRDKYKKAGIKSWKDIKNMEDFKKLPYLTREDIDAVDPFDRVFLPESRINIARVTSGTSSNKPLVLFNEVYTPEFYRLNTGRTEAVKYLKSKKIKRMLFLEPISVFSMRLQYYYGYRWLCHIFGDVYNLPLSAKVASATRTDSIMTTSTVLAFFTPFLQKEYDLTKIRYISLGGEYCSRQRLTLLKKLYPKAVFYFHYGSTDSPDRAYVCKNQVSKDPNIFHWDPNSYPETVEDGELVMTMLLKGIFPVIRYKTGEQIEFKDKPCACGAKDPVFEIIGRIGSDSLKLQGTTLTVNSVTAALKNVPGIINDDFKLHAYEVIDKDAIVPKLVIELVKKDKNTPHVKEVEKTISQNLYLSGKMTLSDLVGKGVFKPLEVKFVESLPFETKRKYIVSHKD